MTNDRSFGEEASGYLFHVKLDGLFHVKHQLSAKTRLK